MAVNAAGPERSPCTSSGLSASFQASLDATLQFTGAQAGWIGLCQPDGKLVFPARSGSFPEAWLQLQQGQLAIWGFEVRDGPTLLNTLPNLGLLGEPALHNLLSAPFSQDGRHTGQIVLANKPSGFTSHDAIVLETTANLIGRLFLDRAASSAFHLPPSALYEGLELAPEGVLILDAGGKLLFTNATWCRWTGFRAEELCGHPGPFPFWITHRDLVGLPANALSVSQVASKETPPDATWNGVLPFRTSDHEIFWCAATICSVMEHDPPLTIAYLQRAPVDASALKEVAPRATEEAAEVTSSQLPEGTRSEASTGAVGVDALALLLCPGGGIEFWDDRWERCTGLTRQDLVGISSEHVLDWLFPRQQDREFVADLLNQPTRRAAASMLEVAGRSGGVPMFCTFLPVGSSRPADEGWLILACPQHESVTQNVEVQQFLRQFTSGLAHHLNHYLSLPISLSETALDRDDLPTDLADALGQILERCMKAGRLVAALHDLAAEPPSRLDRIAVSALLRDCIGGYSGEAKQQDVNMLLQVHGPEPWIEADSRMIKTVLRELLANAFQAVAGRPTREILVQVRSDQKEVRLEVHDSGPGFPQGNVAAMLAPFYSTKGPLGPDVAQGDGDALGLGLTVSRHLLGLLGGRLELCSNEHHGACAAIILPRAEPLGTGTPSIQAAPLHTGPDVPLTTAPSSGDGRRRSVK